MMAGCCFGDRREDETRHQRGMREVAFRASGLSVSYLEVHGQYKRGYE